MHSTSSKAVIPTLDKIFALLGNPVSLKTDNGPPWNGEEFKKFSEYLGFRHQRITPLWPKANAECERLMKTIGKVIRTAKIENKNWRQELYTFLRAYRSTPHCTTQKSPAETLLHRTFRTQLPEMPDHKATKSKHRNYEDFREHDRKEKLRMKQYADVRRHANSQELQLGDRVLVKTPKINKFSSYYDPRPYEVTQIKGSMVTASRPGHSITRNSSFFKRTTAAMPERREEEEDDHDDMTTPQQIQQQQQNERQQPQQQRRYPQRLRRLPNRLSDFIVY